MKEFFIRRYRIETGQADARRTLIRVDDSGTLTYVDNQAEAILGFGASALVGQPITRLVAAREDDPLAPTNRHRFERGQSVLVTLRHRDGFFFTAQLTLRLAIKDADQAASAFITLRDCAPLDPRLLALAEQAGHLGIWELDIQDNRLSWSEGLYGLLGLRPGADITPEQALFYCQGGQNRLRALFRRCARTGVPFRMTLELINARQQPRRIRVHGQARKSGPQVVGIAGVVADLTEQRRLAAENTGIRQTLAALLAVTDDLVVAVDPQLNLTFCNQAFRQQVRQTFDIDVQEGDNLRQLLTDFPNERRLMQRLWQRAFELDDFTVEMPLAMGNPELPVYQLRYQRLLDPQGELLGAVQIGRQLCPDSRAHAAQALTDSLQASLAQDRLEALRESLDNDRLELMFQTLRPVASVTWGDHIEILARLRPEDPGAPAMEPAEFLPLAECFDLGRDLDRAVIRKTLAWLGRHSLLEPRLKYCGFNLSPASVLDDSFPDFMAGLLEGMAYAPECFCLEIRETTASQYPDQVTALCEALHRIGCRVALDGAGASVASYSLAARLPVDIIKLDQAMMARLEDDPVQQVMVEALHRIAAASGKATVATFIENHETLRRVRSLGIDYGQGFRLSRPRPLEELTPVAVELDTGRIGGRVE